MNFHCHILKQTGWKVYLNTSMVSVWPAVFDIELFCIFNKIVNIVNFHHQIWIQYENVFKWEQISQVMVQLF